MTFDATALWSATQMALLRALATSVTTLDILLDVRWGQRLLSRLANRWQARVAQLDQDLVELQRERDTLQAQAEALALYIAAVHLGARYLVQEELRFDPSDAQDKEILDSAINLLVKPRLATVDPHEVEPGRYVYYLEMDWTAIRARLSTAIGQEGTEDPGWLREGVEFIDQTFLSGLETTAV